MLPELINEPDLFLNVIRYLPLSSVALLLRSSRHIHDFLKANQRRVRSFFDVHFRFEILGNESGLPDQAFSINAYIGYAKTIVRIEQFHSNSNLLTSGIEIGQGIILTEARKGQVSFRISSEQDLSQAMKFIYTFLISDFLIRSICARMDDNKNQNGSKQISYVETLCDWMAKEGVKVSAFSQNSYPEEQKLLPMILPLDVQRMDLTGDFVLRRTNDLHLLSADFFKQLPKLRQLIAPYWVCEVDDDDLKHFDVLRIFGERSRITQDGLYDWIEEKLRDGPLGATFSIQNESFANEMEDRLEKNHFTYTDEEHRDRYYRGFNGRWIHAWQNRWREGSFSICPSYFDYSLCGNATGKSTNIFLDLRNANAGGLALRHDDGDAEQLSFKVVTKCPRGLGATVVDRLTEFASIYEVGFAKFELFIDIENEDPSAYCVNDALRELASRLKHQMFHSVRCCGDPVDASLQILLMMRQAWPSDYGIVKLHASAAGDALAATIQSLNVETLDALESSLHADFFDKTPSLRSLSFKDSRGCVVEVSDEALQRFYVFKAQRASITGLSASGLKRWIAAALDAEDDEAREIKIRIPDTIFPKELFNELIENAKGSGGIGFTFRFENSLSNSILLGIDPGKTKLLHMIRLEKNEDGPTMFCRLSDERGFGFNF